MTSANGHVDGASKRLEEATPLTNGFRQQDSSVARPHEGPRHGMGHPRTSNGATGKRKRTFGTMLRAKRLDLRLTQRELAGLLKVQPAHIAYLELDRRRPSLSLLDRIAEVLGLERSSLILLSHPEAKSFVSALQEKAEQPPKDLAWKQFVTNKALLLRHNINKQEINILNQIAQLGRIDSPRSFLFILNSIRQAVVEDDF